MRINLPLNILFVYSVCSQFSAIDAKTNDYIDLLDLNDNADYLWGTPENAHTILNNNISDYFARHRLVKRQTEQQLHPLLLQNNDYGPCLTPLGQNGRCRHIIYCRMPELKNDIWRLVAQLCIIEKSSIGICCTNEVSSPRFTPQIVDTGSSNSNIDDARIINRPEQRGCGVTTRQFPRITGGRPAEPEEWPWMAALLREGLPYVWCGGVLITDRHILTAAHCLHKKKKGQMFVRLGEYNTHVLNETRARDFRIGNMVTHIDYDPLTYDHDIGLVHIERATIFNTYIWPVCMPPINEKWEGRTGIVTGWGTQTFGGPHSEILLEVTLPIWNHNDCKNTMVERIPDTVLCAGQPEGGQDSCQGDSGGPLLIQLPNRRWITVGIVSWGVRCGEANRPGMYTRVDKYLDWVLANADI